MLNIKELTKTYASGIQALKRISLDVPAGMFGLLGPNGAGKTTLMKILATLLEPDSGTAEMNGIDLTIDKQGTRKMLGYLPQEFGLYPTLTAVQMLDYFAKLKGVADKKERRALIDALQGRPDIGWATLRGTLAGLLSRPTRDGDRALDRRALPLIEHEAPRQ